MTSCNLRRVKNRTVFQGSCHLQKIQYGTDNEMRLLDEYYFRELFLLVKTHRSVGSPFSVHVLIPGTWNGRGVGPVRNLRYASQRVRRISVLHPETAEDADGVERLSDGHSVQDKRKPEVALRVYTKVVYAIAGFTPCRRDSPRISFLRRASLNLLPLAVDRGVELRSGL